MEIPIIVVLSILVLLLFAQLNIYANKVKVLEQIVELQKKIIQFFGGRNDG